MTFNDFVQLFPISIYPSLLSAYTLKLIVWGLNGVVVGRHRLILKDNEAMGSRKVSECLPDLWDTI